jgi:ectoine hydroxylase
LRAGSASVGRRPRGANGAIRDRTGIIIWRRAANRWAAIRDDIAPIRTSDWPGRLTPVQQQLLGGIGADHGDHAWGHYPEATPLYGWLEERGLLDPANPPLKP